MVAIRISPAQIDMNWNYHAAIKNLRADQDLVDTLIRFQLYSVFDPNVQEFEARTDKQAHNELLSHFENMGFRKLSYSDNLMVISPFEIVCA